MNRLLFDRQSGSPLRPEVWEAMEPWLRSRHGDPSAVHQEGLEARDALEKSRESVAACLGAGSPEEITFTSCGTEAMNLALLGAAANAESSRRHIISTGLEHPAMAEPLRHLEKRGFTITRVQVESDGSIPVERVQELITEETFLIATHWGHHEFGTVQPIEALGKLALERGVLLALDGVAAAGYLDLKVPPGVSMLSLSTHRFGGPRGMGVLFKRRGVRLEPLLFGGSQEMGLRAGSENLPAIIGGAKALELATSELGSTRESTGKVTRVLWNTIEERVPYVKLNGPRWGNDRLPQLLHVSVEFVEGEALVLAGDFAGLALSSGHACANQSLRVSPSMQAVGLPYSLAVGSVRFSVDRNHTVEQAEAAAERFSSVVAKVRGMSEEWLAFERGERESALLPVDFLLDSEETKALRLKSRSSPDSPDRRLPDWKA